jgi:hypothetical protein
METIKVSEAKYLKDYCINFTFNDGTKKIIDLKNELWGTIFSPLNNKEFFQNFKINDFTIEWMNGADFSPEFLYNYEESIS